MMRWHIIRDESLYGKHKGHEHPKEEYPRSIWVCHNNRLKANERIIDILASNGLGQHKLYTRVAEGSIRLTLANRSTKFSEYLKLDAPECTASIAARILGDVS
jgi:hypothetical protein